MRDRNHINPVRTPGLNRTPARPSSLLAPTAPASTHTPLPPVQARFGHNFATLPATAPSVQRKADAANLPNNAPLAEGTQPVNSTEGGEVIQRLSITIDKTVYDKATPVYNLVKQWEGYQGEGDLDLVWVFHTQDKKFDTFQDLTDEIVKGRPGLALMEGHWKRRADKDFASSQTEGFWGKYDPSNKEGNKSSDERSVGDIIASIGPNLLKDIERAGEQSPGQLRIYRGMTRAEGEAIIRWFHGKKAKTEEQLQEGSLNEQDLQNTDNTNKVGIIPVKHHLGGIEQVLRYTQADIVMEFTLKPGAHEVMFQPKYMAIGRQGKGAHAALAAHVKESKGELFPAAEKAEGVLGGRVGVKSEAHGPYSLSLGDNAASRLLFQLMVDKIRIVSQK